MIRFTFLLLFVLTHLAAMAQYAPQAGISGSTAVSSGSPDIEGWAGYCSVHRGYIDIANKALGTTTGGDSSSATGVPDGGIVCLGDSGVAIIRFDAALYDGPGPDFAVFENGFKDPADESMAFLELAFVEVSSDGINYFRFPANSHTPVNTQIPASGVYMNATLIHNLAGKYVAGYGTPFDLNELAGIAGLDISNVTHIRLVDVVGAISGPGSVDIEGNVINDPYPTNFPTGGFDLDAVAAMHLHQTGLAVSGSKAVATISPNPATNYFNIHTNVSASNNLRAAVVSVTGQQMATVTLNGNTTTVDIARFPAGMYYIIISEENETKWAGKILKY
jgi:hypothetical protein